MRSLRAWLVLALLALWSGVAAAVEGGDRMQLQLQDARRVEGFFYSFEGGVIRLTGSGGIQAVPVSLVDSARVGGATLSGAELARRLELRAARLAALPPPDHPTPAPATVVGLSLLWPGAGHAALGDWKSFGGYTAVEGVLVGTAAWAVSRRQSQVLLPLLGLDLLFRGWSAGESARIARRRRGDTKETSAPPRGW